MVPDSAARAIVLGGPSERDLDGFIDNLKREFRRKIQLGAPQVAYWEAITRAVEIDYTQKKLAGNSGEFAKVKLRFERAYGEPDIDLRYGRWHRFDSCTSLEH